MIKVNTICCLTEMIELQVIDYYSDDNVKRFVCGVCGKFTDIKDYCLDDEELLNEIENNEELQNTPIHKELIKRENDVLKMKLKGGVS